MTRFEELLRLAEGGDPFAGAAAQSRLQHGLLRPDSGELRAIAERLVPSALVPRPAPGDVYLVGLEGREGVIFRAAYNAPTRPGRVYVAYAQPGRWARARPCASVCV